MTTDPYGTDKESLGYGPGYREIAAALGPAARVCEIGVLNGGSLRMWRDLFPQGTIAGVDFSPDAHWPDGTGKIVANQTDPALPGILDAYAPAWDLVVDDGSHQGAMTAITFDMLWPRIAPGGFYVIEDWFFGLPLWPSTGWWGGAPRGSKAIADSYDPGMLQLVQNLLTRLDRPYRGPGEDPYLADRDEVDSVNCRYGLAVVRKVSP